MLVDLEINQKNHQAATCMRAQQRREAPLRQLYRHRGNLLELQYVGRYNASKVVDDSRRQHGPHNQQAQHRHLPKLGHHYY